MTNFFDWISKPMNQDDVYNWYLANNITLELSELFRDFCFSLLNLINETYLGDTSIDDKYKFKMTENQNKNHFKWCWDKTIKNFNKEKINFIFNQEDFNFFETLFFDLFYNQKDFEIIKNTIQFFEQIFNIKTKKTKADIEVFKDIYKVLERSLKSI